MISLNVVLDTNQPTNQPPCLCLFISGRCDALVNSALPAGRRLLFHWSSNAIPANNIPKGRHDILTMTTCRRSVLAYNPPTQFPSLSRCLCLPFLPCRTNAEGLVGTELYVKTNQPLFRLRSRFGPLSERPCCLPVRWPRSPLSAVPALPRRRGMPPSLILPTWSHRSGIFPTFLVRSSTPAAPLCSLSLSPSLFCLLLSLSLVLPSLFYRYFDW